MDMLGLSRRLVTLATFLATLLVQLPPVSAAPAFQRLRIPPDTYVISSGGGRLPAACVDMGIPTPKAGNLFTANSGDIRVIRRVGDKNSAPQTLAYALKHWLAFEGENSATGIRVKPKDLVRDAREKVTYRIDVGRNAVVAPTASDINQSLVGQLKLQSEALSRLDRFGKAIEKQHGADNNEIRRFREIKATVEWAITGVDHTNTKVSPSSLTNKTAFSGIVDGFISHYKKYESGRQQYLKALGGDAVAQEIVDVMDYAVYASFVQARFRGVKRTLSEACMFAGYDLSDAGAAAGFHRARDALSNSFGKDHLVVEAFSGIFADVCLNHASQAAAVAISGAKTNPRPLTQAVQRSAEELVRLLDGTDELTSGLRPSEPAAVTNRADLMALRLGGLTETQLETLRTISGLKIGPRGNSLDHTLLLREGDQVLELLTTEGQKPLSLKTEGLGESLIDLRTASAKYPMVAIDGPISTKTLGLLRQAGVYGVIEFPMLARKVTHRPRIPRPILVSSDDTALIAKMWQLDDATLKRDFPDRVRKDGSAARLREELIGQIRRATQKAQENGIQVVSSVTEVKNIKKRYELNKDEMPVFMFHHIEERGGSYLRMNDGDLPFAAISELGPALSCNLYNPDLGYLITGRLGVTKWVDAVVQTTRNLGDKPVLPDEYLGAFYRNYAKRDRRLFGRGNRPLVIPAGMEVPESEADGPSPEDLSFVLRATFAGGMLFPVAGPERK